jgi:hypothetical protein
MLSCHVQTLMQGASGHSQVSCCSWAWEARKRASLTADQCRVRKEEKARLCARHGRSPDDAHGHTELVDSPVMANML